MNVQYKAYADSKIVFEGSHSYNKDLSEHSRTFFQTRDYILFMVGEIAKKHEEKGIDKIVVFYKGIAYSYKITPRTEYTVALIEEKVVN